MTRRPGPVAPVQPSRLLGARQPHAEVAGQENPWPSQAASKPLVSPDRFLDMPPRSRNEALASLMRRMRLCEEQGTGIDKVITSVEIHQLPPPDFRTEGDAVRAVLFAPRRFAEMLPAERIRACYQHAALKYVSGQQMTNASLRERLGIDKQNASQASTVIRQALQEGLIRPADPDHPRAGYVPSWA